MMGWFILHRGDAGGTSAPSPRPHSTRPYINIDEIRG